MSGTDVVIFQNKRKAILYFTIAMAALVLGLMILRNPFWFIRADDPTVVTIAAYFILAAALLTAAYQGAKVFSKKPAIVIDEEGITDHASGITTKKILWKEITGIRMDIVYNKPFIVLNVKDPKRFYKDEKNGLRLRMMDINMRLYQTPVTINAGLLNIPAETLYRVLTERRGR